MVKLRVEEEKQRLQEIASKEKIIAKEKATNEKAKDEGKIDLKVNATLNDLDVVLYPLVTEKAVNMIESENKITFIVNDNANRDRVKSIIEKMYSVKVDKVNIVRDRKGRKKAIVKFAKGVKASELATKLGVL